MNVWKNQETENWSMKLKIIWLFLLGSTIVMAGPGKDQRSYIEKYKDVAIREMKTYGIPASITLAQGMLESANGKSYLAVKANNHFGIKCHEDWSGKRVYQDDDRKNECFRSYKDADESFRDHSLFLKNRSRYAFLFEESPTDYKAWAKGLKKAGYATNRKYPQLLIKLIEDNNLHQYDLEGFNEKPRVADEDEVSPEREIKMNQIQISTNKVKYVVAKENDSYESIAIQTENRVDKLLEYNDLSWDAKLKAGERVYLQPKRKRASREFDSYTVQPGDDMYSISQKFGIRLEYLYKRNKMATGQQPKVGQIIILR